MSNPITNQLPKEILLKYIHTFYGYGNWSKSKFWFIGIEEGGGNEFDSVNNRLLGWQTLGEKELVDKDQLHEYFSINYNKYTHKSLTWEGLISLKLAYENKIVDKEAILSMQGEDWGQSNSDNLLIELFPLPSPSTGQWAYEKEKWVNTETGFTFLKNRRLYHLELGQERSDFIKNKIADYKPDVVVFYGGGSMNEYWQTIIGNSDSEQLLMIEGQTVRFNKVNGTHFFQCPHPASPRIKQYKKNILDKSR